MWCKGAMIHKPYFILDPVINFKIDINLLILHFTAKDNFTKKG